MKIQTTLKFCIFLSWLVWLVFYSLSASINIPTFHLDGAFQTASGLYRLDAGQFPGKDFYPYLGIGPLLALYPFFKILGGNISASIFSAQFVSLFFGLLSVAFIWHLIWRPRSFVTSLAAGCILFLMPLAFANYLLLPLPDWMSSQMSPGNSLRPIRGVAPYLVGITYYFFLLRINAARNKYFFSGLLTGLILLWSNDFAIPSAGLFAVLIITNAIYRSEFQLRNVLAYAAAAIFSWATFLVLATHGHPIELLQYNFIDVANDQWWFFGPYDESTRVLNFQQVKLLLPETMRSLFVIVFLTILCARTKLIEHTLLLWIGVVLFAGGALASVGGHVGGYFGGLNFYGVMVVYIGLARLVWLGLHYISAQVTSHKSQVTNMLLAIVFCISTSLMLISLNNFISSAASARNDPNRFYVSELGGYLGLEWKDYIGLARASNEKEIFEEYWGLWSATRKIFPAWPVDSVIHTLGNVRTKAASALKNGKLIITTKESAYPGWVGWNISQSYWFYQDLLRDWTPIYQSPLTTVWRRGERNLSSVEVPCQIVEKNKMSIVVDQPGLLEVNVQYSVSGFRSLLLLDNNFSFSPVTNGFVSLNPKAGNALIPAYAAKKGKNIYFAHFLPSNRNGDSRLESCKAKLFIGDLVYGQSMVRKNCVSDSFYLTDVNWTCGVARRWAGFFLPNNKKITDDFKVGKRVKFNDATTREISKVEANGIYLNVFVNGYPLDPEKVGSPDKFSTINQPLVKSTGSNK